MYITEYPAVPGPYRAFARITGSWGPLRASYEEAAADAAERTPEPSAALTRSGESWSVAAEDPEAPGRTVDADEGLAIWPAHGRSCGSVRWPSE